jgi:hypothetical protein
MRLSFCRSAALGAMQRLIKRCKVQGVSKQDARVGAAPLVSPASASAAAPP